MKVKILYYEPKVKEFRSRKTLVNFLRNKQSHEIIQVTEIKKGINYILRLYKNFHFIEVEGYGEIPYKNNESDVLEI